MNFRKAFWLCFLVPALPAFSAFIPKKIATGHLFTCAVSIEGDLKCWGANDFGQLGTGNTYNYGFYPNSMGANLPKVDLGTGMKVADVCAGEAFACAIVNDGKVKCWGGNDHGSLGQGWTSSNPNYGMGDHLPVTNLG